MVPLRRSGPWGDRRPRSRRGNSKSSGNRQPKCSSFAERLAAAERKAYALKKERDALKKASEQSDGLAAKLREKDEMIQEVRVLGRFADGAETLRT